MCVRRRRCPVLCRCAIVVDFDLYDVVALRVAVVALLFVLLSAPRAACRRWHRATTSRLRVFSSRPTPRTRSTLRARAKGACVRACVQRVFFFRRARFAERSRAASLSLCVRNDTCAAWRASGCQTTPASRGKCVATKKALSGCRRIRSSSMSPSVSCLER